MRPWQCRDATRRKMSKNQPNRGSLRTNLSVLPSRNKPRSDSLSKSLRPPPMTAALARPQRPRVSELRSGQWTNRTTFDLIGGSKQGIAKLSSQTEVERLDAVRAGDPRTTQPFGGPRELRVEKGLRESEAGEILGRDFGEQENSNLTTSARPLFNGSGELQPVFSTDFNSVDRPSTAVSRA